MQTTPLRERRIRSLPARGVIPLLWGPTSYTRTSSLRYLLLFSIFWSTRRGQTPPLQREVFLGAAAFPPVEKAIQGFPMHPYFQQLVDKEWAAPARYKDPGQLSSRPYALVPEAMDHFRAPPRLCHHGHPGCPFSSAS